MKRYDWSALSPSERQNVLARPANRIAADVQDTVRRVFQEAECEGEVAVRRWARALDGAEPYALDLTPRAASIARSALAADDVAAIEYAIDQVRFFHEATKPASQTIETNPGVLCRRVWRPIESCGLYVPAGSAPLVSTLIMLAEPARAAGVPNRIAVTPPGKDGAPHPALVAAAAACGLEQLWVIGGAQAIAALALGVVTPRARKIFGPGNVYVAEAKRYAASMANGPAIDLPAGPSELLVITDASADATLVAADLLSQAEHDPDAQVLLASSSDDVLELVQRELERQLSDLPRAQIARASLANARAIRVGDMAEAAAVANAYAPEHLSLQLTRPEVVLERIVNAGTVFVGAFSAETFGDYVVGPSHVLPTDGAAMAFAGVTTAAFMKSMVVQTIGGEGASALAPAAARLARLEGLEAHARAADLRIAALEKAADPAEPVLRRRRASVVRETRETRIAVSVDLDKQSSAQIDTGVGFFDHMLEQVAHHGGFFLSLKCEGDLHIDAHHTLEDCALALGQALKQALGERRGIARFGFVLPMDETEARVSLDLGGRPYLVFAGEFGASALGAYPTEMTEHIFRSLSQTLGATMHIAVQGENDHHKTEACFKALGRALRQAIRVEASELPSTKGVI